MPRGGYLFLSFVVCCALGTKLASCCYPLRLGGRTMPVARDCQRHAARCLQDARETIDPRQKALLVQMAQAWQRLAEREASNDYSCSAAELDRGD
jgi:hypothetical protein